MKTLRLHIFVIEPSRDTVRAWSRVAKLDVKYPTPDSNIPKFSTPSFQNFRLRPFQNFRLRLPTPTPQHEGNEIWLKINGNRVPARTLWFNKSFKRNCTISTGIPNCGVRCKKWSNWAPGVGRKIRLRFRLPVLLGIRLRLHPKISDSATLV